MSTGHLTGRAPLMMVEAYWEGLRNGRLLPSRGEVQARGLGAAIDHAFILERVVNGFARLRVAGTRLNDLLGMETRGMPISALFQPDDRSDLSDTLESVFADPSIADLTLDARGDVSRPSLTGEMLLMPLRGDLGEVSRALGCLIFDGPVGTPPRRFRIRDIHRRPLPDAADPATCRASETTRLHSVQPGFAEDRNGFDPAPRPRRSPGRPNLRLVKSDETPDR